jgi:hypothetical protein
MEDVVAAVRKNDAFSFLLPAAALNQQLLARIDSAHPQFLL